MGTLHKTDCLIALRAMPDNSVDSIVTDPPYDLTSGNSSSGGFMGKSWDATGIAFRVELWAECLRVLKPGGHLLAFGGTRTYHRMAVAIEDAGFEVRDSIHWTYGSGYPKSLNVSSAIDRLAGVEPEPAVSHAPLKKTISPGQMNLPGWDDEVDEVKQAPASVNTPPAIDPESTIDDATWSDWGTALKPSHEPIIVARKSLISTVAEGVLQYGTGALNIGGCRIGVLDDAYQENCSGDRGHARTRTSNNVGATDLRVGGGRNASGRWPANTILTHSAGCRPIGMKRVKTSSPASGPTLVGASGGVARGRFNGMGDRRPADHASEDGAEKVLNWSCAHDCPVLGMDRQSGAGASRFFNQTMWDDDADSPAFLYYAKASKSERDAGLEHLRDRDGGIKNSSGRGFSEDDPYKTLVVKNNHPTVKPVSLLRHLVRLVTPPGGIVMDPFLGSGTTAVAAILEGFDWVGCEITEDYWQIIDGRVAWANGVVLRRQPSLFDL